MNNKTKQTKKTKKINKTKEYIATETIDYCSPPPWSRAKTKRHAWEIGYESGKSEGYQIATKELSEERKKLNSEEHRVLIQVLDSLSKIADSASHAMLSFKGHL